MTSHRKAVLKLIVNAGDTGWFGYGGPEIAAARWLVSAGLAAPFPGDSRKWLATDAGRSEVSS